MFSFHFTSCFQHIFYLSLAVGLIYTCSRTFFLTRNQEAVAQTCSVKKVFLEISQNSQENTCANVSFLIKLQQVPASLLKTRLWHRCFPVNFAKFIRAPFFTEHHWWLPLEVKIMCWELYVLGSSKIVCFNMMTSLWFERWLHWYFMC